MTYNDARHIVTTIAAQHCSKDDHKMLTHTPSTADKHYIEVSNMIMPHRREIPILEALQRKLANKHHVKVVFFLKKSLEIQTRQSSTEDHNQRPETPASPSSLSGESAGFEGDTKTNMSILMLRESPTIGPSDTLPVRARGRGVLSSLWSPCCILEQDTFTPTVLSNQIVFGKPI